MKGKRQGSLLSGYGLIWVIIGLILGLLLLSIASKSWLGIERPSRQLTGDKPQVTQKLVNLAESCWQEHSGDSESDVCQVTYIKSPQKISEANFTRLLNCNLLENSDYGCGSKNEVDWRVNCKSCSIKIQYKPGRILIKSLD